MMDTLSPEDRSNLMGRIRGKNTKPEMVVRRLVHRMGYRYRLHRKDLPGRPDLVFAARRKVIFVHGCFWHQHEGCRLAYKPKTRVAFWHTKLEANRARDTRNQHDLRAAGWDVLVIWECETRASNRAGLLETKIKRFLDAAGENRPVMAYLGE